MKTTAPRPPQQQQQQSGQPSVSERTSKSRFKITAFLLGMWDHREIALFDNGGGGVGGRGGNGGDGTTAVPSESAPAAGRS